MNIRLATSNDWEKFRDLRLTGMKTDPQAFGGDLNEELNRKEPEWRKRLENTGRFFFVAEDADVFVAMAGAMKNDDTTWTLVSVYTALVARGKGLAQNLTKQVIDESKKRGATTIQLMVNIDQKDAVKIYEKAGFKILKILKDETMSDEKLHDEYFMEKNLNN